MDAAWVVALHSWASSDVWLASVVTVLAQDGIFLLPLALVAIWLTSRPGDGRREAVIAGCAAAAIGAALGLFLEHTLARPRPFVGLGFTPLMPHVPDSSFPSDHTLVGVALTGALLFRVPRIGVWLVGLALLVGFARVAAGVHYPSDILGSMVVALIVDALTWLVLVRALPSFPPALQAFVNPPKTRKEKQA